MPNCAFFVPHHISSLVVLALLIACIGSDFSFKNTHHSKNVVDNGIHLNPDLLSLVSRQVQMRSNLWKEFSKIRPQNILPSVFYLPMRDNVELFTTYWAIDASPRPTVFLRSPYGPTTENMALLYLPFGYNIVMQNARATGFSEGDWNFFLNCWLDGNDTMTWIVSQPWSNGVIYQIGASADGFLTYFDTSIPTPFLQGQWLIYSSGTPYFTAYENGGAFRESLTTKWLDLMHIFRPEAPSYLPAVLSNEGYDSWWAPRNMWNFTNVNFPAIHTSGWYDIFTGPMLDTFRRYQLTTGPRARSSQRLIAGPRGHCLFMSNDYDLYFPDGLNDFIWSFEASLDIFQVERYMSEDEINMKRRLSVALEPYTFYIMGTPPTLFKDHIGMYWTTLPSWPTTQDITFFLTDDSSLSLSSPSSPKPFKYTYTYDPSKPVPTLCGNNLFITCGPCDQRPIESRPDVLLFTTPPLQEQIVLFGAAQVTLFVSSNRNDTDFTTKLTDVYPDGTSTLISDTMLRMRWRLSMSKPTPMVPGQVYEIVIDFWKTGQIFDRGHQIRLAISSSNSPRFSANPNNGLLVRQGGPLLIAQNTLLISKTHPSRIVIPTVELSQIPPNVNN